MNEMQHFLPWEWQPIENMPDGCAADILRDDLGNTTELCSCDYWWWPKEKKELYTTFRCE